MSCGFCPNSVLDPPEPGAEGEGRRVIGIAQGPSNEMSKFLPEIQKGPARAKVTDCELEEMSWDDNLYREKFEVLEWQ
ncbi:hypothetical protein NHQ30_006949 [Ciborinia camelliae]|nr:hypothetical protein NHQ30_006949 [Ciborinia camelliae]